MTSSHLKTNGKPSEFKILVVIASYGNGNDRYLHQVINQYRSMSHKVSIVVLSNLAKDLGPEVEVLVGLPIKNPWSLPFAHKKIFAERINDYDLFIYSEDDILITEQNIAAFLRMSAVLPNDEIAGFLRIEKDDQGRIYFPEVHHRFHWDPQSVCTRGDYTFAFFTNEHSASYLLTRAQLQRAIQSGGFLVEPYEGRYDMLCTAATDPYTRCGFRKLVCISHLDDFLVHHLPNKYLDRLGTVGSEVYRQIDALLGIARNGHATPPLFNTDTRLPLAPFSTYYSKRYYEPARPEILDLIDHGVRSVLSVGAGWGAIEEKLTEKGLRVVCIPLDNVISASAQARGLEVVDSDLQVALRTLSAQRFDCLLLSNVLHLVENPIELLSAFSSLLSSDAKIIAITPNLLRLTAMWKSLKGGQQLRDLASYERTGVHFAFHRTLAKWLEAAGCRVEVIVNNVVGDRAQKLSSATLGLMDPVLAAELVAVARRN